jgi:hypothetical protein
MKVKSYLLNQNIRILTLGSAEQQGRGGRPGLIRLARNLELKYGFLQGPRIVSDYNFQTGVTFLEGQFGETFITKLAVHGNGVLAEANASTEAIDDFLEDLISWAAAELGTTFTEVPGSRGYLSQIEAEFDASLGEAFSEFLQFGKRIAERLTSYGVNTENFEMSQLAFHCDLTKLTIPKPGPAFILARRDGEPYEGDIYFASAPLNTSDHLNLLKELEEILSARISS